MQIKTKKVYYCDFCKKHSLLPLKKHELHCTGNLNRQCQLCEGSPNYQEIVNKLKTRYDIVIDIISWHDKEITSKEIMELVDSCPICALTIIRHIDAKYMDIRFKYKEELAKWWEITNAERY